MNFSQIYRKWQKYATAHRGVMVLTLFVVLGNAVPQIAPVEAKAAELSQNEAIETQEWVVTEPGEEQPLLFAPDRYTIRTERRTITGYSSTVDQCDSTPFDTAIGSRVRKGIVAANWLPIGTMIRFPEYDPSRWYVVEDRMHPRFGDRVDIWFEARETAAKFGKRKLLVEIATPVKQ